MRSNEQDAVNFMLRVPENALDTIEATILDNLRPIRNKFEDDFQKMKQELSNLRSHVLDANEEKAKIEREIENARADITNHRVLDEVKQKELEMLQFKNMPKHHKLSQKTVIPKPKEQIFQFPKKMKPFDRHVWPDPIFNHNLQPDNVLVTETHNLDVKMEKGIIYDHFSSDKLAAIQSDPNKMQRAEVQFLGKENQGVKQDSEKFPNLPDDYENYQNLDRPKLLEDKFDKEHDYVDIYIKNKERLYMDKNKQLNPVPSQTRNVFSEYENISDRELSKFEQKKIDFDKIDKVVDQMLIGDKYKYDNYKDHGNKSTYDSKNKNNFFTKTGNSILQTRNDHEQSFPRTAKTHYPGEPLVREDLSFYTKKNQVDPREYFKAPESYVKDRVNYINHYDTNTMGNRVMSEQPQRPMIHNQFDFSRNYNQSLI